MKKLVLSLAGLFIAGLVAQEKSPKNYSYIARMQLPAGIKSSDIKTYYKGTLLSFDDSWCLLPEDQKCLTFSVIITPGQIEPVCEGNTTRCLRRNVHAPCAWYDLTLAIDPQYASGYKWTIEKKDPADMPTRLPERTVLLYTNPEFIEKVEYVETQKPAGFSSETLVINFPTIVFTKHVDRELFEETAVTALLASLDLDTIHARVKKASKTDQHIVISMLSKQ